MLEKTMHEIAREKNLSYKFQKEFAVEWDDICNFLNSRVRNLDQIYLVKKEVERKK